MFTRPGHRPTVPEGQPAVAAGNCERHEPGRLERLRAQWARLTCGMYTAPSELILAIGTTLFGIVLWFPGDAFAHGSAFARLDDLVGSEWLLASLVCVLAAFLWVGLLFDRWPVRWHCWVFFACAIWWFFAFVDSLITRWRSPAWVLTLMPTIASYYVWRALRRQRLAASYQAERAERDTGQA